MSDFTREWSETEWLERLRAGDDAAFEAWVRRESPRLLAVTRRILRCEDEAQDALQDAFLSAFRALEHFNGESRLSTWLHRIAVNAALMRLRSRRRRPEESIDELLPRFDADGCHVDSEPRRAPDAESELERAELAARVRACIDRLPESHRLVIVLRDIEGLDGRQTAEALGCGADAVKMRLHRARQALRTLLVREGVVEAPPAASARRPSSLVAAAIAALRPARPARGNTGRAPLRAVAARLSLSAS
jgi:RNA polymerase sigma-70 factor (ECF subfamily)